MDAETRQLRQRLSDAGQVPDIVILKQTTTSTNDDVRELAQKNISSILICSETQTQGRGQHQRVWISPKGNIYLSTLINSQTPLDGRLALEVALNILQMPKLQGLNLQVKWPNDLYSQQGKWGGILVEPLSTHQAIVGVGINLFTPESQDPLQPISSLQRYLQSSGPSSADIVWKSLHSFIWPFSKPRNGLSMAVTILQNGSIIMPHLCRNWFILNIIKDK